jgi:crotonobetainyl-CoA:carnitine CoA-transferase CaiB-like acyl-CoA transferase
MSDDLKEGPLTSYRVLEIGSTVAGPFCGRLFADFGAEVIKVEPKEGDLVRSMGKRQNGKSLYAASIFRGKRLVAIDLRTEKGRAVVKKIVPHCDVMIENFRPGTLEKWGLGYDALAAINPKLILVRISGFGQTGPYRTRPGYGIIGEAVSGLREITGDPDRPPARVSVSLTDYITGLYAAFGAMMALEARHRTGKGQVVDAALYEGAFSFTEPHVPAYANLGLVATRTGSRLPDNIPNNLYQTKDGRYIHITAVSDSLFRDLCDLMGRPELATDERFATSVARMKNEAAIDAIIAEWIGARTLEKAEKALMAAAIPAARIYTMADIFKDRHFRERDMLVEMPDEDLGAVTVAGVVPKLSATPGRVRWLGRKIGEDTRHVLGAVAGLSSDEVARLAAAGVVYLGDSASTARRKSA